MDATAGESAPDFVDISRINFDKRGWKQPQPTKGGNGPILIYPSVSETNRTWVQFSIYEPPEDSVVAIDITEDNHKELSLKRQAELERMPMMRTDFHTLTTGFGGDPHIGTNRRVYITNISPEVYQHFRNIDEANIQALVKNSPSWFNRQLSEESVRMGYTPCATLYPKPDKVDDASKCQPAIACRLDVRPERLDVLVQSPDAYNVLNPGTYKDIPRGARIVPYFTDSGVFIRKNESGAQIVLSQVIVMDGVYNSSIRPKAKVARMGFTVERFTPTAASSTHEHAGATNDAFSTLAQQGSAMAEGGIAVSDFTGETTQVGGFGGQQAVMFC
jgi:hypothetical protein